MQRKKGRIVYTPLVKEAGEALQDYILNARPRSDSPEVFLRLITPTTGLTDAVSMGCMFQQYQKKAGMGCGQTKEEI